MTASRCSVPAGRLQQYDDPQTVLAAPATDFVADVRRARPRIPRIVVPNAPTTCRFTRSAPAVESELAAARARTGRMGTRGDRRRAPTGWIDVAGVEAHPRGTHHRTRRTSAGGSLFSGRRRSAPGTRRGNLVAVRNRCRRRRVGSGAVGGIDATEVIDAARRATRARKTDRGTESHGTGDSGRASMSYLIDNFSTSST